MRCRPNDLAIVTRVPDCFAALRGRVVQVTTPFVVRGTVCWRLTKTEWFVVQGCVLSVADGSYAHSGERIGIDSAKDEWLTPIRPDPEPTETENLKARAATRMADAAAPVGCALAATRHADDRGDESAWAVGRATTTRTDQRSGTPRAPRVPVQGVTP